MDERIEKAFAVANYMSTLSNQRRVILEEYTQKLVYYTNGATFKVDPNLINFIKNVIDLGHTTDVPFIDANNFPVIISDVQEFFDSVVSVYFEALNEYAAKYSELKSKRKIADIVEL
jgi:predicted 3-demethylubiquinone-9 3-methyltransferase (glyoxalase superfamily)